MLKHINQISEQAFLLDFGSAIDIKTNSFVIAFANHILNHIKENDKLDIKYNFKYGRITLIKISLGKS